MLNQIEPFVGTEALALRQLTKRTLRSRNQQIYRNVYLPNGEQLTAERRAIAAWLWSGRRATVAGLSAAALHGSSWIDGSEPAELTRTVGGANGIIIHRERLRDDEVTTVRGVPITTPARTAFDLGRRKGLTQAVIRVDALANACALNASAIHPLVEAHRGARGLVQLREVLELMDGGAESPQETRTRLLLVDARFRKTQTQIAVLDPSGYPFARVDMGWEEFLVGPGVRRRAALEGSGTARSRHRPARQARCTRLADRPRQCRDTALPAPGHPPAHVCRTRSARCPWLGECVVDARQIA